LASTSLTNGSTITAAKWSVTGDFAFSSNNAAFTFSSGVGTLTQTSGNLAIAIVPNALYAFTYTITGVSNTNFSKNPVMSITTGVAATAVRLNSWANGTYTAYFYAAGSPGNFVINVSGASSGEAFTIGTLSLQQVNLGPLTVGAATASSLALTGSAPAITATGTTPYINASGPLEQRMQCSFNLTTSTLTTAASPVNLCTF